MKRRMCKILSLILIMAMSFTLIAAAASENPPLGTAPVYRTLSDGTIYTRIYSGWTNNYINIDAALNNTAVATLISSVSGIPMIGCVSAATTILSYMRQYSIDSGSIGVESYKYIETRQKPGNISPVFTTIYYMTYRFPGGGVKKQTLTYTSMNPYSTPVVYE